MAHHEYETIIIIRPDVDDAAIEAIAEKLEGIITGSGGHILIRDDWGKKRLAYPIAKHQKGHYILFNYLSQAGEIDELERIIRIDDQIVRFLTVRRAEAVDVDTRLKAAEEQRRLRAEERARAEAEAAARAEAEAEARAEAEAALARQNAEAAAAEQAAEAAEGEDEQAGDDQPAV